MGLTTSYYTIDGQICGESSDGTRLDYLTDALGSVTAKVDQTGAISSRARYKPFGDKLSGSDYTYGWVGSYGYRKAVDGSYVRARHYSKANGSWKAVDSYWPFAADSYTYSRLNPTLASDPSGNKTIITREAKVLPEPNKCGDTYIAWKFTISPMEGVNGWLIQELTFSPFDVLECDGKRRSAPCFGGYYEAWQVKNGVVMKRSFGNWGKPDSTNDRWGAPRSFENRDNAIVGCGFDAKKIQWNGETRFFATEDISDSWLKNQGFNLNGNGCSGLLPAAQLFFGWDYGLNGDKAWFWLDFACCKKNQECGPGNIPGPCDQCNPSLSDACRKTTFDYDPKQK